jgi:hypothetical protein
MAGTRYLPVKRFRELTRQEQQERMELSADLLPVLQFWRGDPRLNHWEESFLTGMVRHLQNFHGAAKIAPKQWDKIQEILAKVTVEPAEQDESEEIES